MKHGIKLSLPLLLLLAPSLMANNLQLWQQSASQLGDYAAGAAAIADDATTAYYNPAGLIRIHRQNAALSFLSQINNTQYKGMIIKDMTPVKQPEIQGGETTFIPTLFYGAPISDRWHFGFSITSPFNTETNYNTHEMTRYLVTKSQLYTLDISPALALQIFKPLSVGAGLDIQKAKVTLNQINDIDAQDVTNKNTVDNWALGWHAGILWEIDTKTRAGFSYRSHITHSTSGDQQLYGDTFPYQKNRIKTKFTLPAMMILSVYHEFPHQVSLMASMNYITWHQFKNVAIQNVTGSDYPQLTHTTTRLKNTWRAALGLHYHPNTKVIFRLGAGYAQSPVDTHTRTLYFPDANYYTASLGMGYQFTETFHMDIGYSHAFIKREKIHYTQSSDSQVIQAIGILDSSVDTLGLQFNWLLG